MRFGLPGLQADEAPIGGQGRIVSVDGIKRKLGSSGQMDDFCARGFQLAAKLIMLRLRRREIRRVEESQLTPAIHLGGHVPSSRAWGTHQHALQRSHHGMAIARLAGERWSV